MCYVLIYNKDSSNPNMNYKQTNVKLLTKLIKNQMIAALLLQLFHF